MGVLDPGMRPPALESALRAYAAGALPGPLHALIGAHLELCSHNRDFVAALEGQHASLDVAQASPCCLRKREDRLAAILEQEPLPREKCCRPASQGWPRALAHYVPQGVDGLAFRTLLPGIRECALGGEGEAKAYFYRVRGGKKVPDHLHEGEEFTLVLEGALEDNGRRYGPGEINVAGEATHAPVAVPGEECLCFVVLTGPLRLTGPVGRFLNRFMN